MALRSLNEPFYAIPHHLITLFAAGTAQGIGMVQADPSQEDSNHPMFLHSNIIKWSLRYFLCTKSDGACDDFPQHGYYSHLEDEGSFVYSHLKDNKRVFSTNELEEKGLDPEPAMWKVLEHTACNSVFGNSHLCDRTREHMTKTFGFSFESNKLGQTCIVEPQ